MHYLKFRPGGCYRSGATMTVHLLNGRRLLNKRPNTDLQFLSCDWGTTSFRLGLADPNFPDDSFFISDSDGIKKIHTRWEDSAGSPARESFYQSFLKKKISFLENMLKKNLTGVPVVVSGMVSSSIGIKNLPYSELPLRLKEPEVHVEELEATKEFPHRLYLVSGIKSRDDIMRGEETQLLGLAESFAMKNGIYILPGTHSKHAFVKNYAVTDFKTYLTGELFELLLSQSILAGSVSSPDNHSISRSFKEGIEASLHQNFLHSLFTLRSRTILRKVSGSDNYEYLSGLLIGTELSSLIDKSRGKLIIAGKGQLLKYYEAACDILELKYIAIEITDGITAAGQGKILGHILKK